MARILVVDDDADILRLVDRVLRMSGHEVFTARDAMMAMDLLNSTLYDILITDANMPRFSGFELVRTLKNNRRFRRMGICMLTGLREKKDIEKAIRAGVEDYIVKPIDPTLLMQKIEKMLAKKPAHELETLNISEGTSYADAQITFDISVRQISEIGVVLHAPLPITEGLHLHIMGEMFRKMDIKNPPKLKVTASRRLLEFEYETHLAFVGITEETREKIENWISLQSRLGGRNPKKGEAA